MDIQSYRDRIRWEFVVHIIDLHDEENDNLNIVRLRLLY